MHTILPMYIFFATNFYTYNSQQTSNIKKIFRRSILNYFYRYNKKSYGDGLFRKQMEKLLTSNHKCKKTILPFYW